MKCTTCIGNKCATCIGNKCATRIGLKSATRIGMKCASHSAPIGTTIALESVPLRLLQSL